ncbi:hypothetical protein Tco_0905754 [Tanacetum coccineum]
MIHYLVGRKILNIDADENITMDSTHVDIDPNMFRVHDLYGDEVFDKIKVPVLREMLESEKPLKKKDQIRFNFRGTSLIGFLAQSVRSSNAIALDSSYLLVLITGASQSRQHVDTSLIHIESRKPPTKSLFDVGSRRISIVTVNTKEYHSSDVLGNYH